MVALILLVGFVGSIAFVHDYILPPLLRIADALEDIAETLDITFCDDDEEGHVSDSTRIVAALEKLAQIPPPAPPAETKETDESSGQQ